MIYFNKKALSVYFVKKKSAYEFSIIIIILGDISRNLLYQVEFLFISRYFGIGSVSYVLTVLNVHWTITNFFF